MRGKPLAIGIAALVLGLALGSVGTATAATDSAVPAASTVAATCGQLGLRLGASDDQVVDAALAARKAIVDAKVKDGTITQAQADTALKNMEARLTERVSSTAAGCGATGGGMGRGGGMRGGGMGRGGRGGCGGSCTQPTAAQ